MKVFHLFFKQSFPSFLFLKVSVHLQNFEREKISLHFLYIPKLNHKRLLRDWSYVFIVLRFWHKRYWQLYGSFHPHSQRFVYSWFGFFFWICVETWCRLWLRLRYWKKYYLDFRLCMKSICIIDFLSYLMFENYIVPNRLLWYWLDVVGCFSHIEMIGLSNNFSQRYFSIN